MTEDEKRFVKGFTKSKAKSKKKCSSRPECYKKESGRGLFCYFLLLLYFQLNAFFTHYYLAPGTSWSSQIY